MSISRSREPLRLVSPRLFALPEEPPKKEWWKREFYPREAGSGELVFEKLGMKTVLSRAYAKAPLKWVRTFQDASTVWVYASSYGGGLVGGDEIRLKVHVGEEAMGFVTTQASTKVYRSALKAGQTLDARVKAKGALVWLPDSVVCFEGADYAQSQDFHLSEGAGLICHDALLSGRRSRGERWKFRRYENRTRVFREGKMIFYDALRLDPADGSLLEKMGRFNILAYVMVYGAPFAKARESILSQWSPASLKRRPSLLEYLGRVGKEGLVWRLAGADPEEVAARVRQKLSFLRGFLGDDPWKRKLG